MILGIKQQRPDGYSITQQNNSDNKKTLNKIKIQSDSMITTVLHTCCPTYILLACKIFLIYALLWNLLY